MIAKGVLLHVSTFTQSEGRLLGDESLRISECISSLDLCFQAWTRYLSISSRSRSCIERQGNCSWKDVVNMIHIVTVVAGSEGGEQIDVGKGSFLIFFVRSEDLTLQYAQSRLYVEVHIGSAHQRSQS